MLNGFARHRMMNPLLRAQKRQGKFKHEKSEIDVQKEKKEKESKE